MDFIYLNKMCLNDNFPLPKIDRLIDFTIDFKYLSSLDDNLRFHIQRKF